MATLDGDDLTAITNIVTAALAAGVNVTQLGGVGGTNVEGLAAMGVDYEAEAFSVSVIGANAITATSIASNAFTSAKFAASSLNGKGDWLTGNVIVSPVAGNAPERIEETTIRTFSGETYTAQVSGLDVNGEVIDWTALGALEFVVEDERKTDVLLIGNASITKASTYFEVAIPASINVANQRYKWAIRQVTNDIVVLYGNLIVAYAAEAAPTE